VDVTVMGVESHQPKNAALRHLHKFYHALSELKDMKFDGMIITGAPVEQMEFEEVDYWEELVRIMDWTDSHVTSTIFLCWAAQADRKSTRLNSSHVSISYAVFCSKQKNSTKTSS